MARKKKSPRTTRPVEERDVSADPREPARNSTVQNHAPITLEPVITISEAAALKDQLLPHIGRSGEIIIDGSRVESVDTAALQVLLAFVRSARAQGAIIRWSGISSALQNAAQLLGIARLISLQT
ncbi:MAG TPA: STAS domain-containing protein [Gammaproteobacteria bacterium]|nr:STAS domain-containing protein [Gammaproteobacteria bacterium]